MNTALDEGFRTGEKDWKDLSQNANREKVCTEWPWICNSFTSFDLSTLSKFSYNEQILLTKRRFFFFGYKLSPKELRSFLNMFKEHKKHYHRSAQEKPLLERWSSSMGRATFTLSKGWKSWLLATWWGKVKGLPIFHYLQCHRLQTSDGLPMQT